MKKMKKIVSLTIMTISIVEKAFSNNIIASYSEVVNKTFTFKLSDYLGTNLFTTILKIIVTFIIMFCIIYTYRHLFSKKSNKSKTKIITKSTIQKILDINELTTIEYPYEGIATVYKEDHEKDGK